MPGQTNSHGTNRTLAARIAVLLAAPSELAFAAADSTTVNGALPHQVDDHNDDQDQSADPDAAPGLSLTNAYATCTEFRSLLGRTKIVRVSREKNCSQLTRKGLVGRKKQ